MSKKRSTSNSNDKLNTIVGENKDLAPDNSSEVLVKADVNPEVLETPNLGSSDNSDEVLVTADVNPEVLETPNLGSSDNSGEVLVAADANPEVLETPNPDSSLNTTAENPPIVISLQPPNTKLAIKKKYKYLHIIDGEKGGVGKSFFARALCHYFTSKKIPILIVDADTTNPDVSKVYGGEQIAFSENERKSFDADRIFELALENNVLVNLPAQISNIVDSWYSRNNILDIADNPDVKIKICKWFVSSGAFDSTSLFKDSLEKHGTKIKHILVKNLAFCDASEWEGVVTELKKEIKNYKNYGVLEVSFPKLAYKERDVVLKDELKFEAALSVDSVKQKIGILGQQRVKTFLDSAIASIEAAENTLIFHK
jgi:CobQ/CobB/MinD/ParA nucleotide binding domain